MSHEAHEAQLTNTGTTSTWGEHEAETGRLNYHEEAHKLPERGIEEAHKKSNPSDIEGTSASISGTVVVEVKDIQCASA